MPADRLARRYPSLSDTIRAVSDVLAGTPIEDAATAAHMDTAELAAAVEIYDNAGREALAQNASCTDWWQLSIQFTDWAGAERTAAEHLAPLLAHAEADGTITAWWFIRKHPCWRLRIHPHPDNVAKHQLAASLDALTASGHIADWRTTIYEPETAAFGGTASMDHAHALFHADSNAILRTWQNHTGPLGRRELSLLLCTVLLRAARLEWFEIGDVWHHVAAERPLPPNTPPDRLHAMASDLRPLLLADTSADGPLLAPDGPMAFATSWAAAFHQTGTALGTASRDGTLDRGLRHVLAYHTIFHWNRFGLPAHTQAILARAATTAILEHDH